jgi:hypothetical protein
VIDATVKELAGIRNGGAFAGTRLHAPFQIADGKTGHRQVFLARDFRSQAFPWHVLQWHVLPSGFHITSLGKPGEAD